MANITDINWPEVARRAIEGRVALEMVRVKRDRKSIAEAGRRVDAIFEALRTKYGAVKFDSSKR